MSGRALITGISSFTGPYVAGALVARGYEVFGLSQTGPGVDDTIMLSADLLDSRSLHEAIDRCKPDYVIHLAAITYVPHGDIAQMYLTNVVGTRNLLEALSTCKTSPKKVLLASSANVYGNAIEGVLNEETSYSPANDYATSKVAMEYMSAIWANRLSIAVVRPFNYTGVGQADKFLIPKIVKHFQQDKPEIELGNIDVIRDFSDVRFVAEAYCELIDHATPGEAYNICSGTGHSLKSVISTMNEIAGYDIQVKVNPEFVRANEVKQLVGSNDKLFDLCPSLHPIDMQNTLEWMYNTKL